MNDRDEKDLEEVRSALRKAAEVKDPRAMWYLVRDTLNLLTMIVVQGSPAQAPAPAQVPAVKNSLRAGPHKKR